MGCAEKLHGIGRQIKHTFKVFTHAYRPGDGGTLDIQNVFDFIKNINGLTRFAVHFIDKGNNGRGAQATHIH